MTSTEMADLAQPDQTAVIEPGQTLILRYTKLITKEQGEEIRKRIADRLPGVEVLIISACDQVVVYQPSKRHEVLATGGDGDKALADAVQRADRASPQRRRTG